MNTLTKIQIDNSQKICRPYRALKKLMLNCFLPICRPDGATNMSFLTELAVNDQGCGNERG